MNSFFNPITLSFRFAASLYSRCQQTSCHFIAIVSFLPSGQPPVGKMLRKSVGEWDAMLGWLFSDPLPVGAQAPDFALTDDSGRKVSLSGLRGKNVALVFYPGDNTPGCTKQLCEFRDSWNKARARGVQVFGLNPANAKSHANFREKYHFPFPLLVDPGKKVAALYHANGPIIKRTVYLIGPDGVIRFARRGMPSTDEVLAAAR